MTPLVLGMTVLLGTLGAVLRWLAVRALPGAPWWSVGIVNTLGSALVGFIAALPQTDWTFPLVAGLAGSLTTFSTLAVLLVPSTTEGFLKRIVGPLGLHLVLGIGACAAAFLITAALR
jgi:fluoride ion exporter CrcB/FEX